MNVRANAAFEWFKKGDGDLFVANTVTANIDPKSPHWDIVLFHAHQAIEKYLKGCLAAQLAEIPRTHDLPGLLKLCSIGLPGLLPYEHHCNAVNRLYVSSRYPGMKEVDKSEATKAAETALEIKTMIRQKYNS